MGLIDNSVLQNDGKDIKFILYMQISIGKIRHFDYLLHISVNLSHTQKGKIPIKTQILNLCDQEFVEYLLNFGDISYRIKSTNVISFCTMLLCVFRFTP